MSVIEISSRRDGIGKNDVARVNAFRARLIVEYCEYKKRSGLGARPGQLYACQTRGERRAEAEIVFALRDERQCRARI